MIVLIVAAEVGGGRTKAAVRKIKYRKVFRGKEDGKRESFLEAGGHCQCCWI